MSIFVGLDCGGSSSRVMAVDAHGAILYQGHSGAANLVTTPEQKLRRNLQHAANGCPQPGFVCGCFAGLISDHVRERGLAHLRELFPAAQLRAEPDYCAAYYASPQETDICVISGTGSLVCSRLNGQIVKSGGNGYLLGDEGSSYHFGRDAVQHFLREPARATQSLREDILEHFGTTQPHEIVASIYRSPTPATLLGKFAKALGRDAQAEEPYARESLARHFGELGRVVADHYTQFFIHRPKQLTLCLSGGLWKSSPIFKEVFIEMAAGALNVDSLSVVRILRPPLHGAVALAQEMFHEN